MLKGLSMHFFILLCYHNQRRTIWSYFNTHTHALIAIEHPPQYIQLQVCILSYTPSTCTWPIRARALASSACNTGERDTKIVSIQIEHISQWLRDEMSAFVHATDVKYTHAYIFFCGTNVGNQRACHQCERVQFYAKVMLAQVRQGWGDRRFVRMGGFFLNTVYTFAQRYIDVIRLPWIRISELYDSLEQHLGERLWGSVCMMIGSVGLSQIGSVGISVTWFIVMKNIPVLLCFFILFSL